MPPVSYTLRPYRHEDHRWVIELWKLRFGEVHSNFKEHLRDLADPPEHGDYYRTVGGYVVADDRTGVPRGFVLAQTGGGVDFVDEFNGALTEDDLPTSMGFITEIAVQEEVEGMGLATELVEVLHSWFGRQPTGPVYTISWRRDGHDSFDLFSSFGYEEVARVDGFYDSRAECPDCGGSCSCTASILKGEPDPDIVERHTPINIRATPEYGARRVPDV